MNDREDEKPTAEMDLSGNRFVKWLDNFWYHRKWQVIAVAFAVVVCVFCFSQCVQKETYDFCVDYTGNCVLNANEQKALAEVLEKVAPNNKKSEESSVAIIVYSFFDEAELESLYTVNGQLSSAAYASAKAENARRYSDFNTFFMTGECCVYFVSPTVYAQMNHDCLAPLSENFDTLPVSAADEYAIRLADTDFYRYYDAVKVLPEDTLLVLSRKFVWGASSKEEVYRSYTELFRNVVTFEKP